MGSSGSIISGIVILAIAIMFIFAGVECSSCGSSTESDTGGCGSDDGGDAGGCNSDPGCLAADQLEDVEDTESFEDLEDTEDSAETDITEDSGVDLFYDLYQPDFPPEGSPDLRPDNGREILTTDADVFDGDSGHANVSVFYSIDLSDVVLRPNEEPPPRGTMIVSHNAALVFPIDLSETERVIEAVGTDTVITVQTLLTCGGNDAALEAGGASEWDEDRLLLDDDHVLVRGIDASGPYEPPDVADIGILSLSMPHEVPQDEFIRVPETFCVGYRIAGEGWVWDFTPRSPDADEEGGLSLAEIIPDRNGEPITIAGVDMIGILFDDTTAVQLIGFEAHEASLSGDEDMGGDFGFRGDPDLLETGPDISLDTTGDTAREQ